MLDCACASWLTEKLVLPASAPGAAVAVTDVELDVAAAAPQVLADCRALAADSRVAKRVLTDCSELTADCWLLRLVLRRVWGAACSCMSCVMIVVVSSPLTSPSTVVPTMRPPLPEPGERRAGQ